MTRVLITVQDLPVPFDRRVWLSARRSWLRENPFLSGIHWTNGIELGIRLITLAWIRRLLGDWPGATRLFEDNELAVQQIRWVSAVPCRAQEPGVVGQQPRHPRGRRAARGLLRLPFPSGIGRELASDHQKITGQTYAGNRTYGLKGGRETGPHEHRVPHYQ